MLKIRLAQIGDIPLYRAHLERHDQESGNDGDVIFGPYEPYGAPGAAAPRTYEQLELAKTERWSRPVTEVNWERSWILSDEVQVYRTLRLVHPMGLPTTRHWTLLMLGIERSHRAQGWGGQMIRAARDWAQTQPSLSFVRLNVFAHNKPARRLYARLGFVETAIHRDQFRIAGQRIDDIEMSLALR